MANKLGNNLNIINVERRKPQLRALAVEEALDMTGFGKYNHLLLAACSLSLQAMGLDLFGGSFTVAAAACDLGLTLPHRGLLTATPLLGEALAGSGEAYTGNNGGALVAGVVVGSFAWGYLSDTRGRRCTLVWSMGAGFVFAALGCLAPEWRTFMVLKLLSSTL
ncbi:Synaptic vesicle glycoprotein 2B [Eumeta japonica]|uniref:Synaptic vesicle glycoprotein 2B n=1 Tax=Eumeta variegata TaxID=151549 RepID=A0A4C1U5H0_EUMVA|nr:Synaptic vesicle glycoprotein 2B [Eumeta japonica]